MPNQYGEVTPNDWNQMTGTFRNINYMNRLNKREEREQTLFDQSQQEREAQIMARKEVANAYLKADIVDESGNITDQGYQAFLNPQSADKNIAINALKDKGKYAYAYMKAQTEFTGQLLANEQNKKNLHMLAFNKADETYKTQIVPNIQAAEISAGRGNKKQAAQYIANAIQGANHRIRAKAEGDKIETWQIVNGERQPSQTLTVEEALTMAKDYTRENYVNQAAAEIVTGYHQNAQPKTFNLKAPNGKMYRAVQVFKSDSSVDYIFFNKDGSVAKDAPHDLEQAYQKGWQQITEKGQKAAAELRYKQEKTKEAAAKAKESEAKRKREAEKFELQKAGKWKPSGPESDEDERKKYGEKRYEAVSEAVKNYKDASTSPSEIPDEEIEQVKKQAVSGFNKTVMGWKEHGRVKSTGEMLWETQEGKIVNEYGTSVEIKKKPSEDLRVDGTKKGPGFLGALKRPDGKVSTEISIGVVIDGKETEIPTLVPTLTKSEIKHLLSGKKPTPKIVRKAKKHAIARIKAGKSPFFQKDEKQVSKEVQDWRNKIQVS